MHGKVPMVEGRCTQNFRFQLLVFFTFFILFIRHKKEVLELYIKYTYIVTDSADPTYIEFFAISGG